MVQIGQHIGRAPAAGYHDLYPRLLRWAGVATLIGFVWLLYCIGWRMYVTSGMPV